MTPSSSFLLLDTCVVLHLIRGKALGERMDKAYNLRGRAERPLISVVTIGEARSLALQRSWGSAKVERLDALLRELVVVDINNATVLAKYAEIDAHMKKSGRSMSKNDIWIAATAAATGSLLLTNDKDFDPLEGIFISHVYIDPKSS